MLAGVVTVGAVVAVAARACVEAGAVTAGPAGSVALVEAPLPAALEEPAVIEADNGAWLGGKGRRTAPSAAVLGVAVGRAVTVSRLAPALG